jgi:hypothetical protein
MGHIWDICHIRDTLNVSYTPASMKSPTIRSTGEKKKKRHTSVDEVANDPVYWRNHEVDVDRGSHAVVTCSRPHTHTHKKKAL